MKDTYTNPNPLSTELSESDKAFINSLLLPSANVSVNGSVNDTHKNSVKSEPSSNKHQVLAELKTCNYRTPPKTIAKLLENLFSKWPSQEGHWLYIAQHYSPRPINRVVVKIIKEYLRGDKTVKNPAAYFTYLIRFRKQRKSFTATNGGRKQQVS